MPTLRVQLPPPSRSGARVPGRRRLQLRRITTTSARIPSGRLMKKIQRHETESVSEPPASGPTIDAVPHIAPTKP